MGAGGDYSNFPGELVGSLPQRLVLAKTSDNVIQEFDIALILVERGAQVVLGARRANRLVALADRITKAGGEAAYAPTDVRQRDDLSNLVKLACERYGKLDVLVSNPALRQLRSSTNCASPIGRR